MAVAYFNICILWGASTVFTKLGVNSLPPMQFACLRFCLASGILFFIALLRGDRLTRLKHHLRQLIVIGLLLNFLTNSCIVISSMLIDSSVVLLMMATTPILAAGLEIFLKKTAVSRDKILSLACGFLGIFIVIFSGGGEIQANVKGILIILTGVVFWTAGSLYAKGCALDGSVFLQAAVETAAAGLVFFAISRLTGAVPFSQITSASLVPVVFLAIVDSVIGFASYHYLLKVMPASTVCTYAYVNPVVALVLGGPVLGERILPGKIAGMVLVIGSVVWMQRKPLE